jgi:hypothetical protein
MENGLEQNQATLDVLQNVNLSQPQKEERMVPQSEVDKLAWALKNEAYEKAKREFESKQVSVSQNTNSNAPMTREDIQQAIRDETKRQYESSVSAQQQEVNRNFANKVLNEFVQQMNKGKEKYDDFDSIVGKVRFDKYPELIRMSTEILGENTDEVWYELAKNPMKLKTLKSMVEDEEFELAQDTLKGISKSIVDNKNALKNTRQSRQPTVSIKSSARTTSSEPFDRNDKQAMLKHFKQQSWAKRK